MHCCLTVWLCMQLHGDAPCAKLNSVIHAIGVLSLVPDLAAPLPDDGSASELATPPIPTSLVRVPCHPTQSSLPTPPAVEHYKDSLVFESVLC